MLKVVLQSLPTLTMSCLKIPLGVIQQMNKAFGRFWWNSKLQGSNVRKVHWESWDQIYKIKLNGEMGIRDLSSSNKTLLARHVWRLLSNHNSLLSTYF